MSTTAVRSAAEYESRLQQYNFERAEEGRAVRVGEKEVSEQAAIVARYRDLFTRPQIEALLEAEGSAEGAERERLYRLRKACEGGVISAELAEQQDALENALLAARVTFRGEEMPLRNAQAKLAVLTAYAASTASFACALRSGISSPWNTTRSASSRFSSSSSRSASCAEMRPDSQVFRSR